MVRPYVCSPVTDTELNVADYFKASKMQYTPADIRPLR